MRQRLKNKGDLSIIDGLIKNLKQKADRSEEEMMRVLPSMEELIETGDKRYKNLNLEDKLFMCNYLKYTKYNPGEYIYLPGENVTTCYILLSGTAALVAPKSLARHGSLILGRGVQQYRQEVKDHTVGLELLGQEVKEDEGEGEEIKGEGVLGVLGPGPGSGPPGLGSGSGAQNLKTPAPDPNPAEGESGGVVVPAIDLSENVKVDVREGIERENKGEREAGAGGNADVDIDVDRDMDLDAKGESPLSTQATMREIHKVLTLAVLRTHELQLIENIKLGALSANHLFLNQKITGVGLESRTITEFATIEKDDFIRGMHRIEAKHMQIFVDYLRSLPYFKHWSKHALIKMKTLFNTRKLTKGQYLFKTNDIPKYIFIVKEGEIEVNAKHRQQKTKEVLYAEYLGPNAANAKKKKGRAIYAKDNNKIGSKFLEETFMLNLYVISKNQFVGLVEGLEESPYLCSAKCKTLTAEVYYMNREKFLQRVHGNDATWNMILKEAEYKIDFECERKTQIKKIKIEKDYWQSLNADIEMEPKKEITYKDGRVSSRAKVTLLEPTTLEERINKLNFDPLQPREFFLHTDMDSSTISRNQGMIADQRGGGGNSLSTMGVGGNGGGGVGMGSPGDTITATGTGDRKYIYSGGRKLINPSAPMLLKNSTIYNRSSSSHSHNYNHNNRNLTGRDGISDLRNILEKGCKSRTYSRTPDLGVRTALKEVLGGIKRMERTHMGRNRNSVEPVELSRTVNSLQGGVEWRKMNKSMRHATDRKRNSAWRNRDANMIATARRALWGNNTHNNNAGNITNPREESKWYNYSTTKMGITSGRGGMNATYRASPMRDWGSEDQIMYMPIASTLRGRAPGGNTISKTFARSFFG